MAKKEKGTCEVCDKAPRVLNPIDSGHKVCNACLKELRPPRPRHLATLNQIERARAFGFDVCDDATKEEVRKLIDSHYAARHCEKKIADLKQKLSHYRITEKDWEKRESEMGDFSNSETAINDVAWGMYNLAITRAQSHDELSRLYWDMARMLLYEGRDCSELQKRAATESLLHMREQVKQMTPGATKGVRVLGGCTPSNKLGKRILNLDEAIDNCPIPCENCDRDKGEDQNWCVCCFNFEFNL